MNKKALSPLIATLLLIGFAVVLGLVVMNWGKAYIEEKAEFVAGPSAESVCPVVKLSIIKVGEAQKVCYNPSEKTITVFIENGPDAAIENLQARVIGSAGIFTVDKALTEEMEPASSMQLKFNYENVGEVQQVKITPRFETDHGTNFCINQAVVSEDLSQC